ncbi:TetR/AcrR family transcriptional regulator [Amycolatopsis azurea]|uniref:TetR family transcriptional regulator n=1 Tax=Amycolatopsis azurea DSM 43854 TaxID=1238180 RepID=M2PN51_9PSEU|nr:TetR/AcrR family transcriptional regulator [Amycolatopsis azurea]EMD25948.1 Transcriptional regulator, TetR family [Amycolatopsis azurea DSM 43854]OOC01783.1 TetR family transcriptional regulator [Amycolatopsis azurea DSM 43854]
MAQRTRADALSRERIVEAAVALLDADGERGLTFRTLTERLATGPGAIYWHLANKGELLDAATDSVIADALTAEPGVGSPQDEIRAVALGLFEAIDRHPWLSTQLAVQLSRSPWGTVTPRIFESIGRRVSALGVPEATWFTATSALVHYIFGAAGQNAANAQVLRFGGTDRAEFLRAAVDAWEGLDPGEFPFLKSIAGQVREHDDREQFLTGIDLILTGITAQGRS